MTKPKPPFDFDPATLRDPDYKARFQALLRRARAIREEGAYVNLVTQREVLGELEARYRENQEAYQQHYVQNRQAWEALRRQIARDKRQLLPTDYQTLLEKLDAIEAYLTRSAYTENAKARPLLAEAQNILEESLQAGSEAERALEQHRVALKAAMEEVWAEDYETLKHQYQRLKSGLAIERLPLDSLDIDPEAVNTYRGQRTRDVNTALEKFGKGRKAKATLESFRSGYAHRRDFEASLERLKAGKRRRQIVVALLLAALAVVAGFAIWKVPEYLQVQAMEKAFEKARSLDTWQAYDDFLKDFPESPLAPRAREYQNLLDYGTIESLVLPGGDTVRYEGALDLGNPDGVGRAAFRDGRIYDGNWRAGYFEGQGTLRYPDGSEFIGGFDNHQRDEGTYRRADGAEFTGSWKNGQLTGNGSGQWPDGSRYAGAWKNGKFNGFGTFSAGEDFRKILEGGEGWGDGASYTGKWERGKREGSGTFQYADGRIFVGKWKNDLPDGRPGTLKWPDGSRFRGAWEVGRISGDGVFIDRFGNDFSGYWEGTPENITRRLPGTNKVERGRFEKGRFMQP